MVEDFSRMANDLTERLYQWLRLNIRAPEGFAPKPIDFSEEARRPISPDAVKTPRDLAPYIDHTLLKPEATAEEVLAVARQGREHGFAAVCVHSAQVRAVAEVLQGSATRVAAVVGFPLGTSSSKAKAYEAECAVRDGASEIDMVIHWAALKDRDYRSVLQDVRAVVSASGDAWVKVILEVGQLTSEEKVAGCALAQAAGACFVKTSTGFSSGGATTDDVALLRKVVGNKMGVKASGGIRSAAAALQMLRVGANRIGTSASLAIVASTAFDEVT